MKENAVSEKRPDTNVRERTGKSKRYQILLGPKAERRLQYYKERIEPSTNTEVVRISLMIFDDLMKSLDDGNEFLMRDKQGTLSPYRLLIDID